MSKVLKVENGNYRVAVQDGGTITLDTGDVTGNTIITGNLEVKGTTTTVESTNTTIADNIITLNEGELGAGISASNNYQAGIEVDRGSLGVGRWIWDDQINWSMGGDSGSGAWASRLGLGSDVVPIKIPGVVGTGSNFFFDIGSGVLSVTNASNYEEQIFPYAGGVITGGPIDDDNIPNAKAVVDYIAFSLGSVFQDRIEEGTTTKTFVETKDFEVTGSDSVVEIGIDNVVRVSVKQDTIDVGDLQFDGTTIRPANSTDNLYLEGTGAGEIIARDLFSIEQNSIAPTYAPDRLKLYVQTEAVGGTGLFFVNTSNKNDEIISNNRSLLYSMLF